MELTDKQIKDLVARRHPEYIKKKSTGISSPAHTLAGVPGSMTTFSDTSKKVIRSSRSVWNAPTASITPEVVNLINKYLFKEDIHRNVEEAPEPIQKFWKRATRQNVSIDGFMSALDLQSSIYGRVWVVVDSTMDSDAESVADEKKKDVRAYAYWISPQQMLDMAWDDDGNLIWALIVEVARDDQDPFTSSGGNISVIVYGHVTSGIYSGKRLRKARECWSSDRKSCA